MILNFARSEYISLLKKVGNPLSKLVLTMQSLYFEAASGKDPIFKYGSSTSSKIRRILLESMFIGLRIKTVGFAPFSHYSLEIDF